MNYPPRILVFETSALLSTLRLFTDPHTHDPEALERLMESPAPGAAPLVDKVMIPDHVLYELTGILPICFAEMHARFAKAKNDPEALKQEIDLYALASPRGEVNDPAGEQKSHVRMLLHFVARHPDCLIATETARAYCQRLKADYAVLGASNEDVAGQYRPTFSDAFHYLGAAFRYDELRVHAGQLLMMGLISEAGYNDRISRVETSLSKQQRFYLTAEFLDKISEKDQEKGGKQTKSGYIPPELAKYITRTEAATTAQEPNRDIHKDYLTLGLLRRYPQVLRIHAEKFQTATPSGIIATKLDDEELFHAAVGPSHLLMEHYLHSGIIPKTPPSLLAVAGVFGFDISDLRPDDDYDHIKDVLYRQGFYEISPTLEQLRRMCDATHAHGIDAPLLDAFIAAIPEALKSTQQRFREACRHPNEQGLAHQSGLRMPYIGLPYEKVFADALVNGALSWVQFQQLVQENGGLPRRYDGYCGSPGGDVLLKPSVNPDQAHILIAQEGFVSRQGRTEPDTYISRATRTVSLGEKQRSYYDLSVQDMIERCRRSRNTPVPDGKLYRSFEAMLYRPVTHDAPNLRQAAVRLLGEDHVLQYEKDYANRHARRSLQVQPPYRSLFSALHTNSRSLRKNLGEVATSEAASTVAQSNPEALVWVVNHDSDLFCDTTQALQLEDTVMRQHAGLHEKVRRLNDTLRQEERLYMVNTEQFLDSLHLLMNRPPHKPYGVVSAKPLILEHRSSSWASLVHDPVKATRQR